MAASARAHDDRVSERTSTPSAGRGGLRPLSESGLTLLVLVGIAAAVFTSYVVHGGFYSDDWSNAASVREHGYVGAIGSRLDVIPNRPLLAVLQLLPHAVFGADPRPQLVLAVVLAIMVSACFFYLLRMVHMPAVAAATVASLVLLFPWSDSSRLWPEGSINQVAVILYLLGAITALWGLRSSGRRALVIHLFASTLFVASVLTYEATGPLALATGFLYFAFTTRRRALIAWVLDIVAVGAAIGFSAATTTKTIRSGHSQIINLWEMARGAAVLTARAVFPVIGRHTWVVVAVGRRRRRSGDPACAPSHGSAAFNGTPQSAGHIGCGHGLDWSELRDVHPCGLLEPAKAGPREPRKSPGGITYRPLRLHVRDASRLARVTVGSLATTPTNWFGQSHRDSSRGRLRSPPQQRRRYLEAGICGGTRCIDNPPPDPPGARRRNDHLHLSCASAGGAAHTCVL
jgi:hypothetical protein